MTRIGEMNRPLQLQSRQPGIDAEGRPQELWSTIARRWGHVQPLSASEYMLAAQAGLTLTHQVECRFHKELAAIPQAGGPQAGHNLRFLDGGRVLDIKAVIHVDEARKYMRLLCAELEPV